MEEVPTVGDLVWRSVGMAVAVYLIRSTVNRLFCKPISRYFQLRERRTTEHDPELQSSYRRARVYRALCRLMPAYSLEGWLYVGSSYEADKKTTKVPDVATLMAADTGLQTRAIQRWLRGLNRETLDDKFRTQAWRVCFYVFMTASAGWLLSEKPYFWDLRQCFMGDQTPDPTVYWYYSVSLGYYWCSLIWMFNDVGAKKDFVNHLIHHCVTIGLLLGSWTMVRARIGAMILFIHSSSDWLMSLAKGVFYLGFVKTASVVLAIFTFAWFYSRFYLFPLWLIHASIVYGLESYGAELSDPVGVLERTPFLWYAMLVLLIAIFTLDCIWSVLLVIWFKNVVGGAKLQDIRSGSELEESAGEKEGKKVPAAEGTEGGKIDNGGVPQNQGNGTKQDLAARIKEDSPEILEAEEVRGWLDSNENKFQEN